MARHFVSVALLWIALTALSYTVFLLDLYPVVGSDDAKVFDDIFDLLLILGMPVFAFVIAVIAYSMYAFRQRDFAEFGASFRGTGMVPIIWVVATSALATLVIIHPGLTGLAHLQKVDPTGYGWGEEDGELVVNVTAFRWSWTFEYPEQGFTVQGQGQELVIPVDTSIRFNVDSTDVVHSFWIPAFRMKIDTLPGRTTFFTVRPTVTGAYDPANSSEFRVQCAELCGLDHGGMRFPVRVVTVEEFDEWVEERQGEAQTRARGD